MPTVRDTANDINGGNGGAIGGGQVVSNINDINSIGGSGHLVGGESLLRRRLSDSNVIIYGKFITYYIVYIII